LKGWIYARLYKTLCLHFSNHQSGEMAGKDPLWYQEDESKILTVEVSNACAHYMPG
jgi:hypothetical protein